MVKSLAQCTGCGTKLRFELRAEARIVRCPKCNTEIELAGINKPPPAVPAPEPPPVHVEPEVVEDGYSFSKLFSRSEQASIQYVSSASIMFDFEFRKFATPSLIRSLWQVLVFGYFIYLFGVFVVMVISIAYASQSKPELSFAYFFAFLLWPIMAIAIALIGYLYLFAARIILEVCIVLFDIAENIRKLANNS